MFGVAFYIHADSRERGQKKTSFDMRRVTSEPARTRDTHAVDLRYHFKQAEGGRFRFTAAGPFSTFSGRSAVRRAISRRRSIADAPRRRSLRCTRWPHMGQRSGGLLSSRSRAALGAALAVSEVMLMQYSRRRAERRGRGD